MSNDHVHPIFRKLLEPFAPPAQREHEESGECWCGPTLDYVADDGTKHWIHHEAN